MKLESKFEQSRNLIEKKFFGPYRLDQKVVEALLKARPGIYIWFEPVGENLRGYCGQALDLPERLKFWAKDLNAAGFYFLYVKKTKLRQIEKLWIKRAGDLNKIG